MATPPFTPEVQSRWNKFFKKDPRAMLASLSWNLANFAALNRDRVRFGLIPWAPRNKGSAYLSYYPDGFYTFAGLSDLYRSWVRGVKANNNGDAGRFVALLLNLRQLQQDAVPGDFLELGVFKGNSAALLAHFASASGRRLFLCDTFEGFDARDLVGVDQAHHARDFEDTSIEYVRETVGHPDTTTYVKGFFPDSITAEMRDSTFALAHIDCDLYLPMKAALEFIYPRMPRGGMLILHDYSSGTWAGATQAIDEFTQASGEFLTLWPDKSGTAVIRKSSA
jgi:hypothetical protein